MHPILFSIGPITVYSYGLMLAIAFFIAASLASHRSHLFNISKEATNSLALTILITGIIGARLLYILFNLGYFVKHPLQMIMINRGGLVFYGGFLLASACAIVVARRQTLSLLDTGDLLAPFIALGHAIGRIGCLLNGCCYGKPTSSWLGIAFPGDNISTYPTQLFSAGGLFGIFLFLFYLQKRRAFHGQVLVLYIILYGALRFVLDFYRGDLYPILFNLTATQMISIGSVLIGLCMYAITKNNFRLKD